jgi:predicted membrane protein
MVNNTTNKPIQIVIIAIFIALMIFLITLIGFWALIFASFIGVAIALLIERIRNEKKKEAASLTQNWQ